MTAPQRNCYEAIQECLRRYSLDDVLAALQTGLEDQAGLCEIGSPQVNVLCNLHTQIEVARMAMREGGE